MSNGLKARPEEITAAASTFEEHIGYLSYLENKLMGLAAEAKSSWEGGASKSYEDVSEKWNEAMSRCRNTLGLLSENLRAASTAYSENELTNAHNLGNFNFGDDTFPTGKPVMREVDGKTTIECEPGKNCPEDLEKKIEEQQKHINDLENNKVDKKRFEDDALDRAVNGCVIGAVGGLSVGSPTGPAALGAAAVGCVAGGLINGVLGAEIDKITGSFDHKPGQ